MKIKKMKAAILAISNEPLVVDEIELPKELAAGQVLVKVHYSGICGAQINEIEAVKGPDKFLPHLLGHEGSASVIEVGPGVRTVKPEDTVVMHWRPSDGIQAATADYKWKGKKLNSGWVTTLQSHFANLLNSPTLRPPFEYLIAIYYFIYFAVLPRYMLKTEGAVLYFFSVFKKMFIISLVVGVVDLSLAFVGIYPVPLVPRHIADWVLVGFRFHGLAGEPRDAFVYLFLGLAVFCLEAHIKRQPLSKFWTVAVISAALFTQSGSGLVGIGVFLVLFNVYNLTHTMNVRHFLLLLAILTLTPTLMYVAFCSSERLLQYLKSASNLWNLLESGNELPYLMYVQSPNIYPLYDLTVKARELNILPIIFGSGFGSASAISNYYDPRAIGELNNPNSQLVRSLFESGIIGTFFLIRSFLSPVKHLTDLV